MIQYQDEVPTESQRTRSCRSDEVPEQSRYVIPEPGRSDEVREQSRRTRSCRSDKVPEQNRYVIQSHADLMRFQSRADVLPESRADSSAELLWSQSSTGSEEVPMGNHDDCFSGKQ